MDEVRKWKSADEHSCALPYHSKCAGTLIGGFRWQEVLGARQRKN